MLVLDGVTDPHNLGACLRVADGAGAHAVIAPRDRAVGINATVAKVASGAAETVPYLMVTNLARTLGELKERDIVVVGTSDDAEKTRWEERLRNLVAEHAQETQSTYAAQILREWDLQIGHFWQVCPREMVERLDWPLNDEGRRHSA